MIPEIKLFVLILSSLFCLNQIIRFVINLFLDDPKPIKIGLFEKVLFYFSLSYVLSAIILAIT